MGLVPFLDFGNSAVSRVVVNHIRVMDRIALQKNGVQAFLDVVLNIEARDDYCCLLARLYKTIVLLLRPLSHCFAKCVGSKLCCANSRKAFLQARCLVFQTMHEQWPLHLVGR